MEALIPKYEVTFDCTTIRAPAICGITWHPSSLFLTEDGDSDLNAKPVGDGEDPSRR